MARWGSNSFSGRTLEALKSSNIWTCSPYEWNSSVSQQQDVDDTRWSVPKWTNGVTESHGDWYRCARLYYAMLFVVAAFLTSLASVSCSDTLCCIGTAEDEDGHIMFDRLGNTACFKKIDSISYVYISWNIHGMWMICITFERGGPKFSNTTARALT